MLSTKIFQILLKPSIFTSQMVEVRTSEEEVTHGPPQNLRGEAVGPHTLRLTWSPPVAQPPPTKYSIHYTEVRFV